MELYSEMVNYVARAGVGIVRRITSRKLILKLEFRALPTAEGKLQDRSTPVELAQENSNSSIM